MGSPGAIANQVPVLILFDGVCNLCNGAVRFIIKRDRHAKFKFASLQSTFGRTTLQRFKLNPDSLHSVVVIDNDVALEKSNAALQIARHLGYPWKLLTLFHWIPKNVRDGLYNVVAKNRYRLFGRRDACMIPTPEMQGRFLG